MAKELLIDPEVVRAKAEVELGSIPINAYQPDLEQERVLYGDDGLDRIGRDMLLVREFELMLNAIKREGSYLGVSYIHAGPAHLSIGQEAAAVGQAFTLSVEDKVFGSHRSHGEVIAKGLSAIAGSDEAFLDEALSSWSDGVIWKVVEKRLASPDFEQQAINYLLYGMTAETFGRRTGFNRGLGGSMHAFFPPFGIYPNNAIVGGSAPLATGAALYNRIQVQPGLVVASIGDASTGTGPVWESFNFAAMAQLKTLRIPSTEADCRRQQLLRHGPPDHRRNHGVRAPGPDRRRHQPREHARPDDRWQHPLAVIDAMITARRHIDGVDGPVLTPRRTGPRTNLIFGRQRIRSLPTSIGLYRAA
jgi:2-oxoisovalerate dehydrogenase E1 component